MPFFPGLPLSFLLATQYTCAHIRTHTQPGILTVKAALRRRHCSSSFMLSAPTSLLLLTGPYPAQVSVCNTWQCTLTKDTTNTVVEKDKTINIMRSVCNLSHRYLKHTANYRHCLTCENRQQINCPSGPFSTFLSMVQVLQIFFGMFHLLLVPWHMCWDGSGVRIKLVLLLFLKNSQFFSTVLPRTLHVPPVSFAECRLPALFPRPEMTVLCPSSPFFQSEDSGF